MTVGLPGVGLGGIFYLLSAVVMPVRELSRIVRGRATRASRALVLRQAAMVAAILGALWATGWLLGLVITESTHAMILGAHGRHGVGTIQNVMRVGALVLSMATLALVISTVHVARFFVRRGAARAASGSEPLALVSARIEANDRERERSLRVDSGTFGRLR